MNESFQVCWLQYSWPRCALRGWGATPTMLEPRASPAPPRPCPAENAAKQPYAVHAVVSWAIERSYNEVRRAGAPLACGAPVGPGSACVEQRLRCSVEPSVECASLCAGVACPHARNAGAISQVCGAVGQPRVLRFRRGAAAPGGRGAGRRQPPGAVRDLRAGSLAALHAPSRNVLQLAAAAPQSASPHPLWPCLPRMHAGSKQRPCSRRCASWSGSFGRWHSRPAAAE